LLRRYLRQLKSLVQRTGAYLPGVQERHPYRFVFIAGLPKSGTTWIENLVEAVPGYRRLAPYDPGSMLADHILDPVLLDNLPVRGNYFLKTHVEARPKGVAALKTQRVPTLVMVRDLRDQCVSRYFHVLNQPSHRHHKLYSTSPRYEAFSHCLDVTVSEYAEWVRNWLSVLKEEQQLFRLLRFEDARNDIATCFRDVLDHFAIELEESSIDDIISDVTTRARRNKDLKQGIRKGTNTFRSGKIGEWKDFFTPENTAYFKSHANDVLIDCGYEFDDSWQAGEK